MSEAKETDAPIVVRRATAEDMAAIGRLGALLVRVHHEFDRLRFLEATDGTERGYAGFLGGQLKSADVVILVAARDDEVVGYTYAALEGIDYQSLRGAAGVLHDLMVDPGHRGRGIGRKLLQATLAVLKERGAPRVVLSTAAQNAGAQGLFEGMGFRRTMIEMTCELGEGE